MSWHFCTFGSLTKRSSSQWKQILLLTTIRKRSLKTVAQVQCPFSQSTLCTALSSASLSSSLSHKCRQGCLSLREALPSLNQWINTLVFLLPCNVPRQLWQSCLSWWQPSWYGISSGFANWSPGPASSLMFLYLLWEAGRRDCSSSPASAASLHCETY